MFTKQPYAHYQSAMSSFLVCCPATWLCTLSQQLQEASLELLGESFNKKIVCNLFACGNFQSFDLLCKPFVRGLHGPGSGPRAMPVPDSTDNVWVQAGFWPGSNDSDQT
jgi:hypothetical protein